MIDRCRTPVVNFAMPNSTSPQRLSSSFLDVLATHIRSLKRKNGDKSSVGKVTYSTLTMRDDFRPPRFFSLSLFYLTLSLFIIPLWNEIEERRTNLKHPTILPHVREFRNVFPVAFYLARVSKNEPRTGEVFFPFYFPISFSSWFLWRCDNQTQ